MTSTQTEPVAKLPTILSPWRLLVIALAAGVVFEVLLDPTLRQDGQLGLGFSVAAVLIALVAGSGIFSPGSAPNREVRVASAVLAFFGAMVFLRASPVLATFNALAVVGVLLLIAHTYAGAPLARLSLFDYLQAAFGGVGSAIGGAGPFLTQDLSPARFRFGRIAPLVRGVILALIPLLVFSVLFASADAVFAGYLDRLMNFDIGSIVSRAMWGAVIAWAALGLMRRTVQGPKTFVPLSGTPKLGATDAVTALVLLNLLFGAFVTVQAAYLFGGADTLAVTSLTRAEYARRGFFELVAVGILVVGLVLTLDWLVRRDDQRKVIVDRLHALLLVLTSVVLVSALQRMRLYTDAFGLTELRLYTTVFMFWVAVVLFWMGFTVLRGRRERFPFGALVSALVLLAATNLANPDALISRLNVSHHIASGRELDTDYLTEHLSSDAVPALVASLDRLDECTSNRVLTSLLDRPAEGPSWQGLTWGELQARAVLETTPPSVTPQDC